MILWQVRPQVVRSALGRVSEIAGLLLGSVGLRHHFLGELCRRHYTFGSRAAAEFALSCTCIYAPFHAKDHVRFDRQRFAQWERQRVRHEFHDELVFVSHDEPDANIGFIGQGDAAHLLSVHSCLSRHLVRSECAGPANHYKRSGDSSTAPSVELGLGTGYAHRECGASAACLRGPSLAPIGYRHNGRRSAQVQGTHEERGMLSGWNRCVSNCI